MSEESKEITPDASKEGPVSILDIDAAAPAPKPEQQAKEPVAEEPRVDEPEPKPQVDASSQRRPFADVGREAGEAEGMKGPTPGAGAKTDGKAGPDAGDAKTAPGAEQDASAGGKDGAEKADTGKAGSSKADAGKADAGKAGPGKDAGGKNDQSAGNDADGPDNFAILDKALKDVKFGYKQMPDGPERERNHKLMTLAEQAFIVSGMEDEKRAGDIWQKHTNKPPSADLMGRLADAKAKGHAGERNLSGDLAVIENQTLLAAKQTRMEVMRSQIEESQVTVGDARSRSLKAGRDAQDQLIKPEQTDDAGLYLLKSFAMGIRASRDIKVFMAERKRSIDKSKDIDATKERLGQLAIETKAFEVTLAKLEGVDPSKTVGTSGKAVQAAVKRGMPSIVKMTGITLGDQLKKAAMASTLVVDATVGARKPNPNQTAFQMFQQSQMGGMGR